MSVFKRGDSPWYTIEFSDPRIPGGTLTIAARTKKKKEAEERERAIRTALDWGVRDLVARLRKGTAKGGLHVTDVLNAVNEGDPEKLAQMDGGVPMLCASVDRTMQWVRSNKRRRTQDRYRETLRQLEAFMGAEREPAPPAEDGAIIRDVPLTAITFERAEDFLLGKKVDRTGKLGKPWAPNTRIIKKAFTQKMFGDALAREMAAAKLAGRKPIISDNPFAAVDVGEAELTRHAWLRFEQLDHLIAVTRGTRLCAWVAVGALAGLRKGERMNLRRDVDVQADRVVDGVARPRIVVQPRDGSHGWLVKSDNGIRNVALPAQLVEILREHVDAGYAGANYLFRSWGKDQPINADTATEWTKEAFRLAGIPYGREKKDDFTDHSLRHTYGSLLAVMNVHPKRGAKLMGITVAQYMKTYLHLAPEDDEATVALLDAGLAAARAKGAEK